MSPVAELVRFHSQVRGWRYSFPILLKIACKLARPLQTDANDQKQTAIRAMAAGVV
jgi:hypothetical protein